MQYFDIYEWPKNYVEDSLLAESDELENIFVDDYIAKVLNTKVGDTDEIHEAHLEELIKVISNLASFFSRLRVTVDQILGNLILERLLDEADKVAEGNSNLGEKNPFVKVEDKDLLEELKQLFEEE
ncbi:MAG: hypothetical protein CMC31_00280 [Flavobacteriaceae bacterium]|mgnify:CR=1 FL=1|nr:hypothetical protein [Flavobacteriaceae bacterium]